MWKNGLIFILALALAASLVRQFSSSTPKPVITPTPRTIETLLQSLQHEPGFEAASIGFCLLDDSPEPLLSWQAEEAMTPASSLKCVTSATALERLGIDFHFTTTLAATSAINVSGQLNGDLFIIGGGDPMLQSDTFRQWASDLKQRGLQSISGSIVADASFFPDHLAADAWDWGDVSNYYGAGPSGLNLDFNRFEALIAPGNAVGEPALLLGLQPLLPGINIENTLLTGPEDSGDRTAIYGGPYSRTLTFRGTVPAKGDTFTTRGAIPDPALNAAWQLTNALLDQGVRIDGKPQTARALLLQGKALPTRSVILQEAQSPPLIDIVRYLHKTSDNMVTECLFQVLAKQPNETRPPLEIIRHHWQERGLTFIGLRMEDGSGLARADFIRPKDLAHLLWLTRRSPSGDAFKDSLNAYENGTIHWKGGSMSRVRCYAGYIDTQHGERTFALMMNNYEADSDAVSRWRDRLIQAAME